MDEREVMDHPTATDWQNRCERAEAECKELRERVELLARKERTARAFRTLYRKGYLAAQETIASLCAETLAPNTTTNGS